MQTGHPHSGRVSAFTEARLSLASVLLIASQYEERQRLISPQPYVGRKIMIQQVASSARQTLAAAKATSLQRCVRTQLRAGRHCLNPRARSPRRLLPLIGATTNDASKIANKLPAPAAARAAAEKTMARRRRARPRRRQRTRPPRHRNDPGREWCSTVATDAPNRQAQRPTHNSASNTSAIDATFP